jgi:SEL1 protein
MYTIPGGISAGVEGVASVPRDFGQSRAYFLKVARRVWPRDNPMKPHFSKVADVDSTDFYFAILSAHFLGRMHLRGEGVRQDIKTARMWFERAAKEGDRESLNALGIIYRDGLLDGTPKGEVAIVQFSRAAVQDLPEALVNMGKKYYGAGFRVISDKILMVSPVQRRETSNMQRLILTMQSGMGPSSKHITTQLQSTPAWLVPMRH